LQKVRSTTRVSGLAAIIDGFDGVVLDLWGCLHDGIRVYPAARDCLVQLRRLGRRIIIMSNAPRRRNVVAARISELGLTPDLYDELASSGEETWLALHSRSISGLERAATVLPIMAERDAAILDGLGLTPTDDPALADFVLAVGVEGPQSTVAQFMPMLRLAIERGLPMVCANPDLLVHRGNTPEICAGAIAKTYEELGGSVTWFGKPHAGIYQRALENTGIPMHRVLCVGDSLRTDIAGGIAIGAPTLFIAGGIHHEEVMEQGDLKLDRLQALCRKMQLVPEFAATYLTW